jgi:hypothetical protein
MSVLGGTFNGMPNTCWWMFGHSCTNVGGDIKPDSTDLGRLFLIAFGLVYGNDWLFVPFTVPAGSIANQSSSVPRTAASTPVRSPKTSGKTADVACVVSARWQQDLLTSRDPETRKRD